MSIDGNWEVSMNTPMGEQTGTLTLKADGNSLSGKMDTAMGSEEFDNGTVSGNDLEWSIDISKPMPMTLNFKATVNGDEMTGNVGLGMFGSAPLSGKRLS
jgi:uncharacterized protein involved in outer membrane biogenesis